MTQADDPNGSSGGLPTPLVDTHHHLWDLSRFRYNWLEPAGREDVAAVLGDYAAIRVNYLIDDVLADFRAAGIVKSVHIQADMSDPDPVLETAWLQAIAHEFGFPHAIVAYSDLRSPSVEAELDRHAENANLRGIRVPDESGLIEDPTFRRGVAALGARGLSLQIDTPPRRMPELAELARRFPGIVFFLGHTGFPEARSPEYFRVWRSAVRKIAYQQNVVMKISGLGMGDHEWSFQSIRPWVLEAIEAFGTDRCVFGTNWPVDRLYSDLLTLVNAYRKLMLPFTQAEQDNLLSRNAERLYSI